MKTSKSPRGSYFLWIFAALFIILGLGYSTLTPVFENSDETLHYPYVKYLADGRGLPLAGPGQLWNQEGTQHPLYYALVAATTFWIDSDNLAEHLQYNPHWLFTEVRTLPNDNQNRVIHGPMDAFPYRHTALAIHIGRWWSLAFGLLTVICTALIVQHLFPHNLPLLVTTTALTAFNPQFMRVSATVSNDSLSAGLTTLTILLVLKFTAPQRRQAGGSANQRLSGQISGDSLSFHSSSPAGLFRSWLPPLLLGLLTGLALLTKLSSLTTLFLVGFIIFWRIFFLGETHEAPLQKMIRWLAIIGVITILLSGWWFVRNERLYGEWLATETHLNLAGRGELSLADVWGLRAEAERAYWATFGWGQIRPPEWVYQGVFWFTRIGLLGLIVALPAKLVQGNRRRPLPLNLESIDFEKIIILMIWAALNLVLYLRWVMEVGSVSHTRLIFPAIAAISLLLALGWHALLPRRLVNGFSALIALLLLTLNIYSLGWLIFPAFRPYDAGTAALAAASNSLPGTDLNLTFLNSLRLKSAQIYPAGHNDTATKDPPQAKPGDVVIIEAAWETLTTLDKNYSLAVVLSAPDGSLLARRETYPGLGLRPTQYLQPGDIFIDLYPLKLETAVLEPMVAQATINLFDFDSETRSGWPALDSAGNEVTPIVGHLKIVPDPWPRYQPAYPAEVDFGDAIRLIGYDLDLAASPADSTSNSQAGHSASASSQPSLTLYWESRSPVSKNYNIFLHLLDSNGEIIAQADAPVTNQRYPTRWWSPGEVIADTYTLPATEAVMIRLGLYDLESEQRLTVSDSTLPNQDNGIEINLH